MMDSNFVMNSTAYTLQENLYDIRAMLIALPVTERALRLFFEILGTFINKGLYITRDIDSYRIMIAHLVEDFPELIPYLEPALASQQSGGANSQNISQMTVQTFANITEGLRREGILRSVFAILYALWSSEDETNTILPIHIENNTKLWSRDEVHKKLISLYDKFQTSQTGSHEQKMEREKQVEQDMEMAMKEEEGTQPYIDYIPYIERQVKRTKHEGLLAMYNNLLGESEIVIPSDINQLLDDFLQEGVTYKNLFYEQVAPINTTNNKVSDTTFVSKGKVDDVAKTMSAKRFPSIKTHTLPSALPMFTDPKWSAVSAAAGGRHPLHRTRKQQRKQRKQRKQSRSKTYKKRKNQNNQKNQKTRKNQKNQKK
jgi:hypothetical protein